MEEESKIKYQWIKGDNTGGVVTIKEEKNESGINWIYFTNGKRIKGELLKEFLSPFEGTPLIDKSDIEPDPLQSLNPTKSQPQFNTATVESPIKSLLKKQSSKNTEEVKLILNINIPNKNIYNLIRDSYEEDEVDKELTSIVLEQLNSSDIKQQLEKNALEIINSYYSIKITQDEKE